MGFEVPAVGKAGRRHSATGDVDGKLFRVPYTREAVFRTFARRENSSGEIARFASNQARHRVARPAALLRRHPHPMFAIQSLSP